MTCLRRDELPVTNTLTAALGKFLLLPRTKLVHYWNEHLGIELLVSARSQNFIRKIKDGPGICLDAKPDATRHNEASHK